MQRIDLDLLYKLYEEHVISSPIEELDAIFPPMVRGKKETIKKRNKKTLYAKDSVQFSLFHQLISAIYQDSENNTEIQTKEKLKLFLQNSNLKLDHVENCFINRPILSYGKSSKNAIPVYVAAAVFTFITKLNDTFTKDDIRPKIQNLILDCRKYRNNRKKIKRAMDNEKKAAEEGVASSFSGDAHLPDSKKALSPPVKKRKTIPTETYYIYVQVGFFQLIRNKKQYLHFIESIKEICKRKDCKPIESNLETDFRDGIQPTVLIPIGKNEKDCDDREFFNKIKQCACDHDFIHVGIQRCDSEGILSSIQYPSRLFKQHSGEQLKDSPFEEEINRLSPATPC